MKRVALRVVRTAESLVVRMVAWMAVEMVAWMVAK